MTSSASARSAGVKSIRSSIADALPIERRRPGGEGLRRTGLLAGHGRLRHRPLFDRPDRLAGFAIEDEQERLLGWLRQRLDAAAVQRHVEQDRRARQVVVPEAVMDRLVVPLPLAGLDVERDEALVEQRVARPVAAVVVARRHFDRHVDQAELEVRAHLRPRAGVAVLQRRFILPGVVAKLAGLRDGVEDPQPLAGLHVEAAHVALRVAASSAATWPARWAAPTTTTSPATSGVAFRPSSAVTRSSS